MIIEYIRYEVTDADALVRAYEEASRALDASPHCLSYELSRCTEEPSWLLLRIEWDSTEAQIREMRHYEQTSVVKRKA